MKETLLAGRAQLVVPLYLEHILTARALEALGVARVLLARPAPDLMDEAIAAARADGSLASAAQAFARSAPVIADPARLLDAILSSA
jgi:hypothetical protein